MASVPVSQYEALRAEMRNLVEQAQKVHEIATQVISTTSSTTSITSSSNHQVFIPLVCVNFALSAPYKRKHWNNLHIYI